jgi:protein-tyrosine phosphatase
MTEALSRLNFRDVGGLPTQDGSVLRPGLIFRSEGPASFEDVHRSELEALGFKLVVDLRADPEREKAPNDWAGSARLLNLNVNDELRSDPSKAWKDLLAADPSAAAVRRAYERTYAAIPGAVLPHLRGLIEAIADGETPALIHCTAGKDRTGVLMALLLKALNVPDDVVLADYLRSDVFAQNLRAAPGMRERMEENFGFLPDDDFIDALTGVHLEYLSAATDELQRKWGSIDGYLAAAGIGPDLLDRYRKVMTA